MLTECEPFSWPYAPAIQRCSDGVLARHCPSNYPSGPRPSKWLLVWAQLKGPSPFYWPSTGGPVLGIAGLVSSRLCIPAFFQGPVWSTLSEAELVLGNQTSVFSSRLSFEPFTTQIRISLWEAFSHLSSDSAAPSLQRINGLQEECRPSQPRSVTESARFTR